MRRLTIIKLQFIIIQNPTSTSRYCQPKYKGLKHFSGEQQIAIQVWKYWGRCSKISRNIGDVVQKYQIIILQISGLVINLYYRCLTP
jgi:hypothetical protein